MRIEDVRVGTIAVCNPNRSNCLVFRDPDYRGTKGVPSVELRPGQRAVCYYKSHGKSGHITRSVTIPDDAIPRSRGRTFEVDSGRYWENLRGLQSPIQV